MILAGSKKRLGALGPVGREAFEAGTRGCDADDDRARGADVAADDRRGPERPIAASGKSPVWPLPAPAHPVPGHALLEHR